MADYSLGHTSLELQRLALQADLLCPITERLLRSAGLRPGMRVLEVGCGAGDVCFLAAELVGLGGQVVGVDRSAASVLFAAERAQSRGARNVSFREGTEAGLPGEAPFDFVIGRYVLVHQPDPANFVRAAAASLRPGGGVAFHEPDSSLALVSRPPVQAYDMLSTEYSRATQAALIRPDAAPRLGAIFAEAGLVASNGFCERLVGMEGSELFFHWRAATYAAFKLATDPHHAPIEVEQLAAELRAAVAAVHAQVLGPDQWCVWATA